jgi:hypothetical protein
MAHLPLELRMKICMLLWHVVKKSKKKTLKKQRSTNHQLFDRRPGRQSRPQRHMPSDPRSALAEAWASPAGRKSHPRRPKQNTFCLKSTLSICCRRSLQHDAAQPGRARGTAGARELLRSCALALTLVASFAVAGCVPLQFEDVGLARAGDLSASRLLTQKVNFCCLKITWTADWCRTSDCLGLGCQTREDIACSDIMSCVCAPLVPYTTRSFCTVIESCRLATLDLEFAKRMVELYTESKPRQICAQALTKVICSYHYIYIYIYIYIYS